MTDHHPVPHRRDIAFAAMSNNNSSSAGSAGDDPSNPGKIQDPGKRLNKYYVQPEGKEAELEEARAEKEKQRREKHDPKRGAGGAKAPTPPTDQKGRDEKGGESGKRDDSGAAAKGGS